MVFDAESGHRAAMIGYLDTFHLIARPCLAAVPLIFLSRRRRVRQ